MAASPGQAGAVFGERRRPGDAACPGAALGPFGGRETVLDEDVGDAQAAARAQHAEALGEHRRPFGRQVDHAIGDDHVHRAVRQRDRLDLAAEELGVADARLARVLAGQVQHLGGHVQAVSLPGRADPAGREQHVDAAAAAQVQHRLPRAQVSYRDRVAAPQACPHRAIGQAARVRVPGRAEAARRGRVRGAAGDGLALLRGPGQPGVPGGDRRPDRVLISWGTGGRHDHPPDVSAGGRGRRR